MQNRHRRDGRRRRAGRHRRWRARRGAAPAGRAAARRRRRRDRGASWRGIQSPACSGASTSRSSTRPIASRCPRAAAPALRPQAARLDPASRPTRSATAAPTRCSAPATPARRSWPRTRAFGLLPGVDRPALATIIPTRAPPAVLLDAGATVGCRPPHLVQFAVHGIGVRARRARLRRAARRAAVGRRGREQGQRADARGAPAAEGRAGQLHRQRRRARRLRRRGRRHRLRRLHRQRHAEGQRRARSRPSKRCCTTSSRRPSAARVGYVLSRQAFRRFRRRVDYSEYGGAPLVGLNGLCIVGHGRSSAKAVAQRRHHGRAVRERDLLGVCRGTWQNRGVAHDRRPIPDPTSIHPDDRVRIPWTGRAEGRHGPSRWPSAFPICRDTFAEADAALGEPLSTLCFDGPDDRLMLTENTQPAILAMSIAVARLRGVARHRSRVRGGAQPRRVFGARRGRVRYPSRMRCARCSARGRYMQEAVPVGEGRWRPFWGSTPKVSRRRAPKRGRRAGRLAGEPQRARDRS